MKPRRIEDRSVNLGSMTRTRIDQRTKVMSKLTCVIKKARPSKRRSGRWPKTSRIVSRFCQRTSDSKPTVNPARRVCTIRSIRPGCNDLTSMIPLAHHGCLPDQARFRQGRCGATVTKAVRPRFASRVVARGRPVEKYRGDHDQSSPVEGDSRGSRKAGSNGSASLRHHSRRSLVRITPPALPDAESHEARLINGAGDGTGCEAGNWPSGDRTGVKVFYCGRKGSVYLSHSRK